MKNKLLLLPCVLLLCCLSSCELDNYDAPDATFYGSVIDEETNQPIQQDLMEGSRIDFIESGFNNPNTRQIRFHSDGTYCENNLFSGTYEVQALRGNFFPSEILTMDIKGNTEYNFRTRPYIRINDVNVAFNDIDGIVTSTFRLEQVATNSVEAVYLYADRNVNVSNSIFAARASESVSAVVSPEREFRLELSTDNLDSGKDYYFRVGALISNISEAKQNFSEPIRLHIDNSKVVPYVPIPGKVLDACETTSGWGGAYVSRTLDGDDKKEGNYSLRVQGTPSQIILQKSYDPFDTEVTLENGYLALELYVSDASAFGTNNQFEITSSGGPDIEELHWTIQQMNLINGWNKVELSLASGDNSGVNLSAINFLRLYNVDLRSDIVLKFDYIRFYSK